LAIAIAAWWILPAGAAASVGQGRIAGARQHLDQFDLPRPGLQRKTGVGAADIGQQPWAVGERDERNGLGRRRLKLNGHDQKGKGDHQA
jgi:hypothetical protein